MDELIKKLEEAQAPLKALMLEVFRAIYPNADTFQSGRFVTLLNVEAWESAVLALVPEGALWGIDNDVPGGMAETKSWHTAWCYGQTAEHECAAIALCIAALKATAQPDRESA